MSRTTKADLEKALVDSRSMNCGLSSQITDLSSQVSKMREKVQYTEKRSEVLKEENGRLIQRLRSIADILKAQLKAKYDTDVDPVQNWDGTSHQHTEESEETRFLRYLINIAEDF